jgi:integrase
MGQSFSGSRMHPLPGRNHMRSYAMDLLHFVRWWASVHHSHAITRNALTSVLTDYVRFQAGQRPRPAPATINRRVIVVGRALRNGFPHAIRTPEPGFSSLYWLRSSLGCGRARPALSRLRVKEPKRIPIPLSADQVTQFWSGFHNARDLAIVGLMLLQGLRSKEVIALDREDVQLTESRICVHGKGNKIRLLPLASDTIHLLDHYLRLERPTRCGPALFVSLKGRTRRTRITLADCARYSVITAAPAGSPAPIHTDFVTHLPLIWFAPESACRR